MLSTQQIETVSGIVENYKHYVVYYYADYHDYQIGEVRDSRIEIYVGSDISFEDNSFTFGEDVNCYYLTNGKYLIPHSCSGHFSIHSDELVYTDLVDKYPSLSYFQTEYNNFDYKPVLAFGLILIFAIMVINRVIFAGGK